jgi:hypothetical protein
MIHINIFEFYLGRNGFRVSFRNPSDGQAHTLFAPDEHSKRQWLAALNKASGHIDQPTLSAAMQTCETDSVAGTPTLGKRLYAHGGKVAKSSARVGLFQVKKTCGKSLNFVKQIDPIISCSWSFSLIFSDFKLLSWNLKKLLKNVIVYEIFKIKIF